MAPKPDAPPLRPHNFFKIFETLFWTVFDWLKSTQSSLALHCWGSFLYSDARWHSEVFSSFLHSFLADNGPEKHFPLDNRKTSWKCWIMPGPKYYSNFPITETHKLIFEYLCSPSTTPKTKARKKMKTKTKTENCTNIWNVRWSHCGKATTTTNGTEVADGGGMGKEMNDWRCYWNKLL